MRDSIGEPPAPPAGSNAGFLSSQALITTTDAWTTELVTGPPAAPPRVPRSLAETAAEYDHADASGAHSFRALRHGG